MKSQVVTEEDLHQMIALGADLLDAIEDGYRALNEGRVNLPRILRMDICKRWPKTATLSRENGHT